MSLLSILLNANKPGIWQTFLSLGRRPSPSVKVPESPEEALTMGYRMGLQEGYGKGLVDGVDLTREIDTLTFSPQAVLTESVEVC